MKLTHAFAAALLSLALAVPAMAGDGDSGPPGAAPGGDGRPGGFHKDRDQRNQAQLERKLDQKAALEAKGNTSGHRYNDLLDAIDRIMDKLGI